MVVNVLLILTNLINIIFEFFNKSLSILFWAVIFLLFTLPHLILYNEGIYSDYLMNKVGFFAILFNIIYIITRIILNGRVKINFKGKVIENYALVKETRKNINIYYFIYVSSFLIIIFGIILRGYSIFNYTWLDGIGYRKSFLEGAASLLITGFSGVGCIAYLRKDKLNFVLVLFAYFLYVLITRARYNIVPFIIPFLIYYIYSGEIKKIFRSILLGIFILFSVFLLQQIRYTGNLLNLINNYSVSEIFNNTFSFILEGNGEFGLSRVFYYFVGNNNNFPKFGEGRTYLRLILLPIPSSILPFKPRDFAMDMWEAWTGISTTIGTMHPTIYGDVYANFGYFGILMGIFYAFLFKFCDIIINKTKIQSKKILYISIISTMYILLSRGAVYNSIANAFWCIILINIIIYFTKSKVRLY